MNKIAVIGLGYVGLPLAIEFGKKYPTIGFDININRIQSLKNFKDFNEQVTDFTESKMLYFTHQEEELRDANIYIITVPTPVDSYKKPDISLLLNATKCVAKYLKKQDIVIYESTTYPTCTKRECIPLLEEISHLKLNQDFFVGYSPERINPGDSTHTLTNITKITSGSNHISAKKINQLYKSIVKKTYLAPSIEVAEAAKAIENAQRDLNIAFVNELSIIFDRLGIDTSEVLKAAKTKWNFLPFTPGLVGGHCISVDPYYLTHISNEYGYHPKVISSGRFINDMMPSFIVQKVIKLLAKHQISPIGAKIAIFGASFKENCKDIRNAKVFEVLKEMQEYGCKVDIFDSLVDKDEVFQTYQVRLHHIEEIKNHTFDVCILAIPHQYFLDLNFDNFLQSNGFIFDIKGILKKKQKNIYKL
ncbi:MULTISPECIES: nucleotide sugar dehydrogenase [unclassified Helicobacter]|uniref:nucleotide sugar dehydrogenase n=1 Tax=unclassified Helicobacter TaxID=2593540 RepID=UPI000CF0D964|nr:MULTISPECIES: nucleotide sugar dehydrogenase [unclassified Helicobacter]